MPKLAILGCGVQSWLRMTMDEKPKLAILGCGVQSWLRMTMDEKVRQTQTKPKYLVIICQFNLFHSVHFNYIIILRV